MNDLQQHALTLERQVRQDQQKYDYWLMAVAASGIGFALHETNGATMQYRQLPLGLAVILWGVSIAAGCHRQNLFASNLWGEKLRSTLRLGIEPGVGSNPQLIELAIATVGCILDKNDKRLIQTKRLQSATLLVGAIAYLAWHVLGMYLRTHQA